MKKNIHILAAILICSVALASCSDKDTDNDVVNPDPATIATDDVETQKFASLRITATKNVDPTLSKALVLDGNTLNASWKEGELVKVYNGEKLIGTLKAESDGATTTLSSDELSPVPAVGNKLTLKFNETDYSEQDGSLETIAEKYDYAIAIVTVKSIEGGKITIEESKADFINQQAIVKFKLVIGTNVLKAKTLKVNGYTITPSAPKEEFFVAIPEGDAKNIHLVANDGTSDYVFYKSNANLTIGKYYTINVKNLTKATTVDLTTLSGDTEIANGSIVTGTLGGNCKISIASGATVMLKDVTINSGITCNGDVSIILEGGNTVKSDYSPGIYIASGSTLTIDGSGSLTAIGNNEAAGIGSGYMIECGNIVINGGIITATGNTGIGGGFGYDNSCGNITINGGTITAIGGDQGAGIGTGAGNGSGNCGDISISGGTVTATGGKTGAGIGSCREGSCGNITISGGTITATGNGRCAGIGSGYPNYSSPYSSSSCGDITITSGVTKVTVTKGNDCENYIGAGNGGSCGIVTIEDPSKIYEGDGSK